ncbi:fructose-bisphosphate aldolase, partial [Candidatus Bathyarchaeota archaeon]
MNQGKKRRLKRILQKDNRTVIVPMDHGVSMGPIKGITNMQSIIDQLLKGGVDAVVLNKGVAKRVELDNAGLIVHLSAISTLTPNANNKV